jgi:outer membrane protein OmpA-like peptidoglycan-associated protein
MQKLVVTIICFLFVFTGFVQEVEKNCLVPGKKVNKLIQSTKDVTELSKIVELYTQASEIEPENAWIPFYQGKYFFETSMELYEKGSSSSEKTAEKYLSKSKELFAKSVGFCSSVHASVYYYLGVINYYQGENEEALKSFREFQEYSNSDVSRYDNDHEDKLRDVKSIVKELEEELALYNNPVPFQPVIVENVSSLSDEYFPMISPDNEMMFYTRKQMKNNPGMSPRIVEEFTFSNRLDMNSPFDSGRPFLKPFNDGSFDSYGSAAMSVDNKEMVICACKDVQTMGQIYRNCDLYSTRYERSGNGGNDFSWTPLENLGPGINDINSWEAQPTISADGNMLIYAKNGAGTQNNDLYISRRGPRGNWLPAIPLKELNTEGKDKSPFLHQDSETLYFVSSCSEDRKGIGGTDIFYSRLEKGKWTKPKNLGFPINTKEDEIGIFVSTDGKLAYYCSQTDGKDWNIYGFQLYEEARPKAVAIIKGELKDANGKPISGATIEVSYGDSGEKETVKVNGNDGKYTAIVKIEQAQDVVVSIQKEGYSFDSKLISKKEIEQIKAYVKQENPRANLVELDKSSEDKADNIKRRTTDGHVDYLHSKKAHSVHTNASKPSPSGITQTNSNKNSIMDGEGIILKSKSPSNLSNSSKQTITNNVMDGEGLKNNTNDFKVNVESSNQSSSSNPTYSLTETLNKIQNKEIEFKTNKELKEEISISNMEPINSMVIRGVDMQVEPLKVGMEYTINNILFPTNSYELTLDSKKIIKQFASYLEKNPTLEISIQGHTDDVGEYSLNFKLSQDRANAVKDYLIELGIKSYRLEALGYGSSKPKVPNSSDSNRKINRRTDFLLKKL